MNRNLPLSVVALAAAVALSACGSTSSGSNSPGMTNMPGMDHPSSMMTGPSAATTASSASHNAVDTMFAQMMVPHHAQAIEMSDTILKKQGIDPRVTALAKKIKAAQSPEIDTMTGWLQAWGEPASMSGDQSMGGTMSADDMNKLNAATGADASKLFLTQMIQHHQGAITMARDELAQGSDKDALSLAQSISSSQQAEISEMNSILGLL
ncbi:DUF305 domain-containing protein [Paenarthrobacter sp. DKR-5]|uniref:DUF305 domain-containing protein n=1 Tax=Paenarthrobacter sp. DKR-5 TaxID=2835535 RepID=UPI001BDC2E25|nr:DUF305 domain-containing protein [Paenarthrobacter sp. DKR-5]MBT1003996.1 DUF305 domain-containing protein [Paenarthrobacter sp. DKR-5]